VTGQQSIVADNLKKAGWSLGLRLSGGFSRANNLRWLTAIATNA
jgi:hypothetical protein